MHRIADPHHRNLRLPHGSEKRGKRLPYVFGSQTRDEGEPAGNAAGIQPLGERDDVVRLSRRPQLDRDRVVHAGEELHVRPGKITRALADPEQVRRAVVPLTRERVLPGERLLVLEQQALVARPDLDLVQRALPLEIDSDRLHEAQRASDLAGKRLVPLAGGRVRDELAVPGVHEREVREASLGERPQQVERRGRLVVPLDEPLRVGDARLGRRLVRVNDVAAEGGQLDPVHELGRPGPRLRELARRCGPP